MVSPGLQAIADCMTEILTAFTYVVCPSVFHVPLWISKTGLKLLVGWRKVGYLLNVSPNTTCAGLPDKKCRNHLAIPLSGYLQKKETPHTYPPHTHAHFSGSGAKLPIAACLSPRAFPRSENPWSSGRQRPKKPQPVLPFALTHLK